MNKYSISRINTFNGCSKKYKYQYVDKIQVNTKLHLNLVNGSTIHEVVGYYINELQQKGGMAIEELPQVYFRAFYRSAVKSYFWKYLELMNWGESDLISITSKVEDNVKLVKKFNKEYEELISQLSAKYEGKKNKTTNNEWLLGQSFYTEGIDNYMYLLMEGIEDMVLSLIDLNSHTGVDLNIEEVYNISLKKDMLLGYFDLSTYNKDTRKGTIIELKTSGTTVVKLKEEHIPQILMYKNLFRETLRKKYQHKKSDIKYYMVYITVLKTKININIIDVSKIEEATFKKDIENNIKMIDLCTKKNLWVANKTSNCSFCNFRGLCLPYIKEDENREDDTNEINQN